MTTMDKPSTNTAWQRAKNLSELEQALDGHRLFVEIYDKWTSSLGKPSRCWQARRNGKTKLWKTRPNAFRIPIKYGLRGYDYIDQNCMGQFRIADSREEAEESNATRS